MGAELLKLTGSPEPPVRRPALRRVVVLCSSMTGAGTTATALNVAARLTRHGDVMLVDCDLTGSGVTAIAHPRAETFAEHGLNDVLQDGTYLAPAMLLAQATPLRTAERVSAGADHIGELRLVPGRGGATTFADDFAKAGRPDDIDAGANCVDAREASRRLDELMALLADWSSSGSRERWVVLDVPPHPFVAPLILDAVSRLAAADAEILEPGCPFPFLLICFASNAEQIGQAARLHTRMGGRWQHADMLCARGSLDAHDLRTHAAEPSARTALPVIPFDQILFGGLQIVGAGSTAGTPAASSYDALVEWLRRLDA